MSTKITIQNYKAVSFLLQGGSSSASALLASLPSAVSGDRGSSSLSPTGSLHSWYQVDDDKYVPPPPYEDKEDSVSLKLLSVSAVADAAAKEAETAAGAESDS